MGRPFSHIGICISGDGLTPFSLVNPPKNTPKNPNLLCKYLIYLIY
jgi:hypothetical protein